MKTQKIYLPTTAGWQPLRAKVIFNPSSGRPDLAAGELVEILAHLQAWRILPEVYLVQPKNQLTPVIEDAIERGFRLIVVCGGDGTVDTAINALVGTQATLGIIPIGTRNNVALSLNIPVGNIPGAIALLRRGRRIKVDVGRICCGDNSRWFLEVATVGLVSALYNAADEIQHGNLARIGDLLGTLVTSTLGEMRLTLNPGEISISAQAHVVLVANTPYFGANFNISPEISFVDGWLDVFVYADLTKLDLISYAVQIGGGVPEDARIRHFRTKEVVVESTPPMPVLADGFGLGDGPVRVTIHAQSLSVMAGRAEQPRLPGELRTTSQDAPLE
jgi:diacylglycerol kinase (ATP)